MTTPVHVRCSEIFQKPPTDLFLATLPIFFQDDNGRVITDQLHAAEAIFRHALKTGDITPLGAFKEAISRSVHTKRMDALFAASGGLDFYISCVMKIDNLPADLQEELRGNMAKREALEIKKSMVPGQMQKTNNGQSMEGLEAGDEHAQIQAQVGQKEHSRQSEVQGTDGITDGMTLMSVDGSPASRVDKRYIPGQPVITTITANGRTIVSRRRNGLRPGMDFND